MIGESSGAAHHELRGRNGETCCPLNEKSPQFDRLRAFRFNRDHSPAMQWEKRLGRLIAWKLDFALLEVACLPAVMN